MIVLGPVALGDEPVGLHADRVGARPAEELLRLGAPSRNDAARILFDEPVDPRGGHARVYAENREGC